MSGLKIIFGVWTLSGILFAVADTGLSLGPLHVDQLSIRVLLLIQPFANFLDRLPEPWIPALIATLFFFILALSEMRSMSTQGASSQFMRAINVAIRPVKRLASWLKSTGIGRRVAAAIPAYARWITVFKAASVGVLAFTLGVSVGGSSIDLDAFLTQLMKAEANWNWIEYKAAQVLIVPALEAEWQPSRTCPDDSGTIRDRDCDEQSTVLYGFPPGWARTVNAREPPYPPRDSSSRTTSPGPGDPPPAGDSDNAQTTDHTYADTGTSRDRLYDQIVTTFGDAWDAVATLVKSNTTQESNLDRIPHDLTPAQISAAREAFEKSAPSGPVFSWTSELVAALFKSAELGGAETTKKLVEKAVSHFAPEAVGKVVGEIVDLFLTGPIVEEILKKTEEYVRTRRFGPSSVAASVRQAARQSLALGDLRRLWNFRIGADTADDRKTTAVFLRQEMVSLFDKTFGSAVLVIPVSYLGEVRDSLVDKTIPVNGSFDPDTVDRAMEAIHYAARPDTKERLERLIALNKFGVDTSRLTDLVRCYCERKAVTGVSVRRFIGWMPKADCMGPC